MMVTCELQIDAVSVSMQQAAVLAPDKRTDALLHQHISIPASLYANCQQHYSLLLLGRRRMVKTTTKRPLAGSSSKAPPAACVPVLNKEHHSLPLISACLQANGVGRSGTSLAERLTSRFGLELTATSKVTKGWDGLQCEQHDGCWAIAALRALGCRLIGSMGDSARLLFCCEIGLKCLKQAAQASQGRPFWLRAWQQVACLARYFSRLVTCSR